MAWAERFRHITEEPNQHLFTWNIPDLVLAFAFFTSAVYAVLGKRFDQQRAAITMSATIGFALSVGLVWWEQANGFSIKDLGPVAVGFAIIILAFVMYQAVRQVGGSWAGAGITLGASILVASIIGINWPINPQIIHTIISMALIAGILAFLMHHRGHHIPTPSQLKSADSRHDMSDLYRDQYVSKKLTNRLHRLRKQANTLKEHPEQKNNYIIQLKRILPAEGWLTQRMARLRMKAYQLRNGHISRLKETRYVYAKLPASEKKKAAAILTARYNQLAGIDARLARLDSAVAQNEQRIISLTRQAQRYSDQREFQKLPGLLKEAEKLQHHNDKLLRLIERTENMLTSIAQKAAQETRQVNNA